MEPGPTRLLSGRRPSPAAAVLMVIGTVVVATVLVYPLKQVAPPVSLGVVYLLGVLVASTYGGLWVGLCTGLLGALAFNWFHIPPVHRFTIRDSQNWVAIVAFVIAAVIASSVAELARSRAQEAERRRREADLAAALTQTVLGGGDREHGLGDAAAVVAAACGAERAVIEVPARPGPPGPGARAFELHGGTETIGRLVVRGSLDGEAEQRLRDHVVPVLEALVSVAIQRDALHAEAVETAALRRSDELKTALLRMVSHDLRSPLTAIVTAAHALQSPTLEPDERTELAAAIVTDAQRLSGMVANLLDLSRLQAGVAAPRRVALALEEVLETAADGTREHVEFRVADDLPLISADGAQLERAFANVLDNAVKHAGERTVQIRAAQVGPRVVVRIVDQGRGISEAECRHIFDAFQRGTDARPGTGHGLGLAIAKGFVEANGGEIKVESVPGKGTSFVVTFPIPAPDTVTA